MLNDNRLSAADLSHDLAALYARAQIIFDAETSRLYAIEARTPCSARVERASQAVDALHFALDAMGEASAQLMAASEA